MILIYINEALSVIKRAIQSIITHTPKKLLKEIILVDDYSNYSKLAKIVLANVTQYFELHQLCHRSLFQFQMTLENPYKTT